MNDTGVPPSAHYDDIAEGYERWWAPVIAPAAVRLLDDLPTPAFGAHVLDVGTGTGTLAVAALERWPAARVTGIDPSTEMLALARANAERRLAGSAASRYSTVAATADGLPFEAATFDAAMSSFVLQLVPNRHRALTEVRRVLRPGAMFGFVTWLRATHAYGPDRILDEVLGEFGFDPREPDPRNGDVASVDAAVAALRRAGFRHAAASAVLLEHRWDAAGYVAFVEYFDEASTFEGLASRERARLRRRVLERVAALPPDDLVLRLPIVYARAEAGS